MQITLATWNINGVKARLETVCKWLADARPDIVCLQEIKSVDEGVPSERFEELGYNVRTHGQKGFNGVAILSKHPIDEVLVGLPGAIGPEGGPDPQARYLEAVISVGSGALRVSSIYLPNGNPTDTLKFPYKLGWMDRLKDHAQALRQGEEAVALCGDFNVIAEDGDVYNPAAWREDALMRPETRARFFAITNLGYQDAWRACTDQTNRYTFWDFQAGAWPKDNGLRIDHILLSPQATDRLASAHIDSRVRGWEKPSDHVPMCCLLNC